MSAPDDRPIQWPQAGQGVSALRPWLSLPALLKLLLWMNGRSLRGRLAALRQQSRLLLFVLGAFITGYLVVGYFLFYKGLEYIYAFPVVGILLSQRILYLIFMFFFVMLVFSNVITAYTTLFKNRETEWFLSLPIPHQHVYFFKFIESLLVSSWALVFLSAPMMAAYGRVHHVESTFYLKVILVYIPFVALPAVAGSWLILLVVRGLARSWLKPALLALFAAGLVILAVGVKPTSEQEAVSSEEAVSFERLLQHTRLSLHPALPSAWAARAIVAWSQGLESEGGFFLLLLIANAAFAILLGFEFAGRLFYPSWSFVATHRAIGHKRKAALRQARGSTSEQPGHLARVLAALPFLSRSVKAMILKDARVFWRDPSQWTQFAVFFGLLCIYILNLRNVSYDFESRFWSTAISYLNLGACTLTLSTLTTRFVFPQFSLEGRRLWIIGLAPIGLPAILLQKFFTAFVSATTVTASLMLASSLTLGLPAGRTLFFLLIIVLMSAALCGLSVGLGALFPNLREDNPSKIVSGFGGTLCLVLSFLYITITIGLVVVPASFEFTAPGLSASSRLLWTFLCLSLALLLALAASILPMAAAIRRVKNLEF